MEIPFQYLLRHGKVDSLVLDKSDYINDMLVLPNNLIVVASSGSLTLYDENFNLIQSIETINGKKIYPHAIEFDESEKCLYMSDWLNRSIFKIDLHFVLIKMIHFERYNVDYQLGICLINNCLLVCHSEDKQIKVYDSNLEFISSFSLDFTPLKIKATNSTICVISSENIYFYRIQDISLWQKYVVSSSDEISVINSTFYISNFTQNSIHCFNENGNLKEVIKLGCNRRYIRYSCAFAKLNNDLLMRSSHEICKFRK